jgi:anti-sigma-K factor RskA
MNLKEYIESGVVELYVMDALSPAEKVEFERILALHPELKKEMETVEKTLMKHAEDNAIDPPAYLKEKVYNTIVSDQSNVRKSDEAKIVQLRPVSSLYAGIAASIILAVVSAACAFIFYGKWKTAEEKILAYEQEKSVLTDQLQQVNQIYADSKNQLAIIRDENTRSIALLSTKPDQQFFARVYWNSRSKKSFIDVTTLPAPDKSQQYQLWALVDGKPVDAGVFNVDSLTIQQVKDVERADAWAVTLEPAGGSASPHLDQMYLLSKS